MKKVTNILFYLFPSIFVIVYWKVKIFPYNYSIILDDPNGKILNSAFLSIFTYKTLFWLLITNLLVFITTQLVKRKFKNAFLALTTLIAGYFMLGYLVNLKCAPHYYSVFIYLSPLVASPEPFETIPIKEAGYQIGPILTKNIINKNMQLRRYAIKGLGEIKYKKATPILKQILLDKTEEYYIRADVLATLDSFNTEESKKIVMDFKILAIDSVDKMIIKLYEVEKLVKNKIGSH